MHFISKVHLESTLSILIPKTKTMLSITKCKKILNRNEIHYTDEEIIMIRDFLYKMAEIELTSNVIKAQYV